MVFGFRAGFLEELALKLDVLHFVGRGVGFARAPPKDGARVDAGLGIVSVLATSSITKAAEAEPGLVVETGAFRLTLIAVFRASLVLEGRAVGRGLSGTSIVGRASALIVEGVEGAGRVIVAKRRGECQRSHG